MSRVGSVRPSADFQIAISFHSLFKRGHSRPNSEGLVEPEHLQLQIPQPETEEHIPAALLAAQSQDSAPGTGSQVEAEFAGFVPCKDLHQPHNSIAERVTKELLEFKLCPGETPISAPCRCYVTLRCKSVL